MNVDRSNISNNNLNNSQSNESQSLFLFYNNEVLSDCVVLNKTTNKEYLAHKVILAAGSKYFYHHLIPPQSEALEQKDNKPILDLPDKLNSKFVLDDDSVFPLLLKFLYSNQNQETIKSEFTNNNVFQLMALSHSLGVTKLTNLIGEYITKNILTEDNCGRIFYEAIVYENENLMTDCLNILKRHFHKVCKNLNEFQIIIDLPLDVFKKLITADDLVVNSEKEICDVVINYIKARKNIVQEGEKPEAVKPAEGEENAENAEKPPEESKPNEPKSDELKPEGELNFVERNKKQLEQMRKKMVKKPLTPQEERSLVEAIRFSFLAHSELLSISVDEIMKPHNDLILEGLSMRLNSYEKNPKTGSFKINLNSRKYIGNFTNLL